MGGLGLKEKCKGRIKVREKGVGLRLQMGVGVKASR